MQRSRGCGISGYETRALVLPRLLSLVAGRLVSRLVAQMTEQEHKELQALYRELALAWKLYDTALRERRYEDASYYARQRESVELRARALLHLVPRPP